MLVLSFAACKSTQAGRITPKIEVQPSRVIVFQNDITLPGTSADTVLSFPEGVADPYIFELQNAWVKIQELQLERERLLSVTVTTKPRTVTVRDTLSPKIFYIEFETDLQIWQVIGNDTSLVASVSKPLPPTCPGATVPQDGSFPWQILALAVGALMVYFVGKKKKDAS